jgi:hypothetical protein
VTKKQINEIFQNSPFASHGKRAASAWKRGFESGVLFLDAYREGREKNPEIITEKDNPYPLDPAQWRDAHAAWNDGYHIGVNYAWHDYITHKKLGERLRRTNVGT